jgi:hypothetical protein
MAPAPTHQTVRLSRGPHRDPAEGMCAMELASVLAGEPFTDRPRAVCPVIGAFVRAYNDLVDRHRRQDLTAAAATAVGTRADLAVERERLLRCVRAAEDALAARSRLWRWRHGGPPQAGGALEATTTHVAHILAADGERGHARALALVEELAAIGDAHAVPVAPPEHAGRGRARQRVARSTDG